jgi:hypothetical protein
MNPGGVEAFVNVKRSDGGFTLMTAMVDTGAEISLFPRHFLDSFEYREIGKISAQQAGIAKQAFEAVEAFITIYLEDLSGAHTKDVEIRAWFSDADVALLGFDGLLDIATLHIDMRQLNGWIEIDD